MPSNLKLQRIRRNIFAFPSNPDNNDTIIAYLFVFYKLSGHRNLISRNISEGNLQGDKVTLIIGCAVRRPIVLIIQRTGYRQRTLIDVHSCALQIRNTFRIILAKEKLISLVRSFYSQGGFRCAGVTAQLHAGHINCVNGTANFNVEGLVSHTILQLIHHGAGRALACNRFQRFTAFQSGSIGVQRLAGPNRLRIHAYAGQIQSNIPARVSRIPIFGCAISSILIHVVGSTAYLDNPIDRIRSSDTALQLCNCFTVQLFAAGSAHLQVSAQKLDIGQVKGVHLAFDLNSNVLGDLTIVAHSQLPNQDTVCTQFLPPLGVVNHRIITIHANELDVSFLCSAGISQLEGDIEATIIFAISPPETGGPVSFI